MSIEAMSVVLGYTVGDSTGKLCLLAWANHAHRDGTAAYCGIKAVSEYAECSPRTVQRHLLHLLAEGFMREGDQKLVAHFPQHQRPIVYDIAMTPEQRQQWKAEAKLGQRRLVATAQGAEGGRRSAEKAATKAVAGDAAEFPQVSPGDFLSPRPGDNVTPGPGVNLTGGPGDAGDTPLVTPVTEPGDTGDTQTVLDPSCEPSQSRTGALASLDAPQLVLVHDAEIVDAVLVEDTTKAQGRGKAEIDPLLAEHRKVANAVVTGWINWHAQHGPVLESGRTHQMLTKSYVVPALESGYSEDQVKRALRDCADVLPGKPAWRRALLRAAGGTAPTPVVSDRIQQAADLIAQRRAARAQAAGGQA